MFRMSFMEQLDLMRKALGSLHRRISEVEIILSRGERQNATSSVCSPSEVSTTTVSKAKVKFTARMRLTGRPHAVWRKAGAELSHDLDRSANGTGFLTTVRKVIVCRVKAE